VEEGALRNAADRRAAEAEEAKSNVRRLVEKLRGDFAGLRARAVGVLSEEELTLDPALDENLREVGRRRLESVDTVFRYERLSRLVGIGRLASWAGLCGADGGGNTGGPPVGAQAVDSVTVYPIPKAAAGGAAAAGYVRLAGAEAAPLLSPVSTISAPRASAPGPLAEAIKLAHSALADFEKRPSIDYGVGAVAVGIPPDAVPGLPEGVASVAALAGRVAKPGYEESLAAAAVREMSGGSTGGGKDGGACGVFEDISFETRRKLRVDRRAALKALADRAPPPNADYPPDTASLALATKFMGDYSLKVCFVLCIIFICFS